MKEIMEEYYNINIKDVEITRITDELGPVKGIVCVWPGE